MNATREAEALVRRWQELQEAQVSGDPRRLASLAAYAAAQARQAGASGEWDLLAREAERHWQHVHEAQPTAGVAARGSHALEELQLDEVSAPDASAEPAESAPSQGRSLGPFIWLAILVGYIVLQVINGLNGGEGP